MPRITRKQQKVFAVDATNNGVFGSLQAQDPVHSQDPDVIQSRTAYSNGWNDATYSAEKLPPLEEFQALQYLFSRQLAYLMQEGISEWDTNTTYYKGSLVKAIQSDGSFILYASLIDNNQGNLVTDTTKWVITNTSTNFHQGIPNWRADVIYSVGDWVKSYNSSTGWMIYESVANSNLNNAVTDTNYWSPKPFATEFPLLMHSWFDHEVNDTSWLRADTFSWQDGTVYSKAYDHLVDDIDGKTETSETVGSYTISYYLADDGHKITTDETAVANIYAESGVAWYYVLDTVNTRFKLPRTKFGFTGLRDTVGKYVAPGLPNITGDFPIAGLNSGTAHGALKKSSTTITGWSSYSSGAYIELDASGSNPIYGNSTTVQPPATQMYLYFYVGQFSQSAIEQTAGLNAELFNGKLDLDGGNASLATAVGFNNAGIRTVIETYSNGTDWYYIRSDNFCVQGGVITNATNQGTTVLLLKAYKDTNYIGFVTVRRSSNNAQGDVNPQFYASSITEAKIGAGGHGGATCQWCAMGYIS